MKTYLEEIVHPGDRASALAHQININSYPNSSVVRVHSHRPTDDFRGPVDYMYSAGILEGFRCGTMRMHTANDGLGSKAQWASMLGTPEAFRTLGFDLLAMCADDIVRFGGLPLVMTNQVDARLITDENFHLFKALMDGYGEALKAANLVGITGKTAVMIKNITGFADDFGKDSLWMAWSGCCNGVTSSVMKMDPHRDIRPGMPIIGLGERGYRCNGGTQFMRIIERLWGSDRKALLGSEEARDFITALTAPSVLYAPYVSELLGWQSNGCQNYVNHGIKGIAHITGGGVWEKLGAILPKGIGADLDQMPHPPEVLTRAQALADEAGIPMTEHECYGTFHGGCGEFLVCENTDAAECVRHGLSSLSGDEGVDVQIVGYTTESPESEIRIQSRFAGREELSSLRPPE